MSEFPIAQPIGGMNVYEQLSHRIDELQKTVVSLVEAQVKIAVSIEELKKQNAIINQQIEILTRAYDSWGGDK